MNEEFKHWLEQQEYDWIYQLTLDNKGKRVWMLSQIYMKMYNVSERYVSRYSWHMIC